MPRVAKIKNQTGQEDVIGEIRQLGVKIESVEHMVALLAENQGGMKYTPFLCYDFTHAPRSKPPQALSETSGCHGLCLR